MNFSRLHGKSQARKVLPWASSDFLGFQIEGQNWRRERCHAFVDCESSFLSDSMPESLATLLLAHSIITQDPRCHPSLVAPIHGSCFARVVELVVTSIGLSSGSKIKLAVITLTKLVKIVVRLASSWTLKAARVPEFSF
ncbi:hypothetical protein AMTRI_Chr01g126190 [Amborella trichopoda]